MANYLYNGVELPDINEVWTDKETYPYALIMHAQFSYAGVAIEYYSLDICTVKAEWVSGAGVSYPGPVTFVSYICCATQESADNCNSAFGTSIQAGEWIYDTTASWEEGKYGAAWDTDTEDCTWANYDVVGDADGTVYLAASDPVPVVDPVISTTSGDGHALYNGVKLPDINEVWTDKETYPYACMASVYTVADGQTITLGRLFLSSSTCVYDGTTLTNQNGENFVYYVYDPDGISGSVYDAWTLSPISFAELELEPTWSNHDILNEDDTVYLAASDPISLEGMTVLEWNGGTAGLTVVEDFYYKVSDAPTVDEQIENVALVLNNTEDNVLTGVVLEGQTNWIYGGHSVLKFPDWDTETYPYAMLLAVLYNNVYYYLLYCLDRLDVVTSKTMYFSDTPMNYIVFTFTNGDDEWTQGTSGTDKTSFSVSPAIWTNTTLYNEDETVYLEASEPVEDYTIPYLEYWVYLSDGNENDAGLYLSGNDTGHVSLFAYTPATIEVTISTPTVTQNLSGEHSYTQGSTDVTLTVTAEVSDGGTLSYQWYKDDTAIDGATDASYTPPTDAIGTATYYCIVTNTLDDLTATTQTESIVIIITRKLFDLQSWLVGYAAGVAGKPLPFSPYKPIEYPTLAKQNTWYKGATYRSDITEINFVDSYTVTGNETESWAADVDGTGSIMCYVTDTVLTIAGNGSGKIMANDDSSLLFSDTSTSSSFRSATAINGLNILDTSNVTTMDNMFQYCMSLTTLDLSSFNTSKVADMSGMFWFCETLASLDVSNFDTSNVTTMLAMFGRCESLTSLDISNFDTSNVTNMYGMFQYCTSLTSLDLSNFDTSNVTTMREMFQHNEMLVSLDLSSFDTSKVTSFVCMFYYCEAIGVIYVGEGWTTTNASITHMFSYCGVSDVTLKE